LTVGSSGTAAERLLLVTARPRILPPLCWGTVTAKSAVNIITWPPIRSVMAAGPLLYGMLLNVTPAMLASMAEDTSCEVLALAALTWPGLALARSMNSLSVLAGTSLFTATISGTEPMKPTGVNAVSWS
jgi:hypothetical protein